MKKISPKIKRTFYFLIGLLFIASAFNLFLLPHNIAAGGFSGLTTVINYVIPINIPVVIFVLNIPLFIIAIKVKGTRFTVTTIISTLLFSIMLELTSFLPVGTQDPLFASIFGGLFYGISSYFIILGETSSGGSDLLAKLLITKWKHFSIGKMYLIIDGIITILAMIVQGSIEAGLYAMTTIFVASMVTDSLISGFNYANLLYIITDKDPCLINESINCKISRGCTNIKGTGMYTNTEKNILFIASKPHEVHIIRECVESIDENAFIIVSSAKEIMGRGFNRL